MKLTDIFKFKLFERTDPVDMETVNENFDQNSHSRFPYPPDPFFQTA